MSDIPPFTSVREFLLASPLYTSYLLNADRKDLNILYRDPYDYKIDGYCCFCEKETTFKMLGASVPKGDPWNDLHNANERDEIKLECGRNEDHQYVYYIKLEKMVVQKIGQYPSLADVAINEIKGRYRSVLKGDNWSELYKAIGLAAHGEGIGAFVYLRRVFERLIYQRFNEFKEREGWDDSCFKALRMHEKIDFLKKYLPDFLIENSRIYSIFSLGIHELDNEGCCGFFDVGKHSILIVLEEDLQKKQRQEQKEMFAQAISKFNKEDTA